ncbi:MAG: hypothetical protein ACJA0H_001288 [Francisellaceae bacterium]|jgi:hypothetical protein
MFNGVAMSLPVNLYKYETLSIQSLLNLKNQTVYFASPAGFNDPYDCAIKAQIDEPTDEEIERLRKIYLSKGWPQNVIHALESKSLLELKPILLKLAREVNSTIIDNFIKNRGVSCFSEVNNELLMWAHYADKYTGFCLEFDTNSEIFEKARKVKYLDTMPKLNIASIFADKEREHIMDLFCIKSKAWEYEQEWRTIHSEASKVFTYDTNSLTGIYFGPEMDPAAIEVICLVLQGQNPNIKFWQGKRSNSDFIVEFSEVLYTSALKVKELGLST